MLKDDTQNLTILRSGTMREAQDGQQAQLLEAFPNRFTARPYMINLVFPEFTSLCPVTKQPDFGTIIVEYIPDKLCVESKSLKLYFFSFRNMGAFMESITNTILEDLFSLLSPCWLRVKGLFAPRGATRINVFVEKMNSSLLPEKSENVNQFLSSWRLEQHQQNHPLI